MDNEKKKRLKKKEWKVGSVSEFLNLTKEEEEVIEKRLDNQQDETEKTDVKLEAFEDPNHKGNSSEYHTGKTCIEGECENPAGTHWSPHWCFKHNVERIRRIDSKLKFFI